MSDDKEEEEDPEWYTGTQLLVIERMKLSKKLSGETPEVSPDLERAWDHLTPEQQQIIAQEMGMEALLRIIQEPAKDDMGSPADEEEITDETQGPRLPDFNDRWGKYDFPC